MYCFNIFTFYLHRAATQNWKIVYFLYLTNPQRNASLNVKYDAGELKQADIIYVLNEAEKENNPLNSLIDLMLTRKEGNMKQPEGKGLNLVQV